MKQPFAVFALMTGLVFGVVLVAAQGQANRIGLLGPPEEPRFSEVRHGLAQGLREQGYTEQTIELLEARVRREDRERVRWAVDGFLQQRVMVLVVIGSQLAKLARETSAELPIVYLTPARCRERT